MGQVRSSCLWGITMERMKYVAALYLFMYFEKLRSFPADKWIRQMPRSLTFCFVKDAGSNISHDACYFFFSFIKTYHAKQNFQVIPVCDTATSKKKFPSWNQSNNNDILEVTYRGTLNNSKTDRQTSFCLEILFVDVKKIRNSTDKNSKSLMCSEKGNKNKGI